VRQVRNRRIVLWAVRACRRVGSRRTIPAPVRRESRRRSHQDNHFDNRVCSPWVGPRSSPLVHHLLTPASVLAVNHHAIRHVDPDRLRRRGRGVVLVVSLLKRRRGSRQGSRLRHQACDRVVVPVSNLQCIRR
jgi:hypothetical protein